MTVIKSEQKSSLLTTSPFNTVSPPNKTVSDTYDNATSAAGAGAPTSSVRASDVGLDDSHFDEALILAEVLGGCLAGVWRVFGGCLAGAR